MIVSGSEDGGICFWNVRSYAEQALINDYFSEKQQQRRAQQHSGDQIDPNIQDNAISDFVIDHFTPINFAPGELVYKLRAHHDVVGAMDIHPFLPIFITGGMDSDCCIKVWKYKGV
jgi:WD40 repeat protein